MRRTAWIAVVGGVLLARTGFAAEGAASVGVTTPAKVAPAARAGSAVPFLGVVVPDRSVGLSSRFEGRLDQLEVGIGAEFHQGQVLARLDAGPLRQELAAAEAAFQGARAEERAAAVTLAEARDKRRRAYTPRLLRLGVFSREELEGFRFGEQAARARLDAARARARELQARVREGQERLAETALVAPFDGVVASVEASPGARVAAGQPLLRLNGTGERRVRFAIPEEEAKRIQAGLPLRVRVPERGLELPGRVESVAPEVDAAARMVFAVAAFEGPVPREVSTGAVVRISLAPPSDGAGQEGR